MLLGISEFWVTYHTPGYNKTNENSIELGHIGPSSFLYFSFFYRIIYCRNWWHFDRMISVPVFKKIYLAGLSELSGRILDIGDIGAFLGAHFSKIRAFGDRVIWRCTVKKLFLEIVQTSQENTCARVSFL